MPRTSRRKRNAWATSSSSPDRRAARRLTDQHWIDETLRLAAKARGKTHPNPMVGCVIVKDGQRIGAGFHRRAGLPHAEIEALRSARGSVQGATLYVNLEPCSHYGRTPPCVNAIIGAGIKRVVCCIKDPNPKVNGRGIAQLRQSGIAVVIGLRKREAKALNAAFLARLESERDDSSRATSSATPSVA